MFKWLARIFSGTKKDVEAMEHDAEFLYNDTKEFGSDLKQGVEEEAELQWEKFRKEINEQLDLMFPSTEEVIEDKDGTPVSEEENLNKLKDFYSTNNALLKKKAKKATSRKMVAKKVTVKTKPAKAAKVKKAAKKVAKKTSKKR